MATNQRGGFGKSKDRGKGLRLLGQYLATASIKPRDAPHTDQISGLTLEILNALILGPSGFAPKPGRYETERFPRIGRKMVSLADDRTYTNEEWAHHFLWHLQRGALRGRGVATRRHAFVDAD